MHLKGADDREDVKLLAENKDQLTQMGFGFYRSMDGTTGVMYNSMHIHPQDLAAADKAGKLRQIAPDADVVNHQVAKLGLLHPVHTMHPSRVPTAPAQPSYQAPPQGAALNLQPPAAGVQRKLASARLAALQPSAPTSGPAPGGGQLLNSVLKQVV